MKERSKDGRPLDTPLDTDALELAALYALSALSSPEMEAVERDYQGHAAFWSEVRSLRDAAAGLAEAGPRARPRRDLWPEIRARVAPGSAARSTDVGLSAQREPAQVWKQWRAGATRAPSVVSAAGDEAFEATGFPGVRVRRLAVDQDAERVTMLVRMDPGTAYPAHRHGGVEECYVVAGDLWIGDDVGASAAGANAAGASAAGMPAVEMHAGDYQRMEKGSRHPVQSTRGGCLLLVTSSRHDELLG